MNINELEENLSFYNGLENLRSIKTKVKKLNKLQKLQKLRAKHDIIYFAEHFFYVSDIDTGFKPIQLRPYQKIMLLYLHKYQHNVFNTSRQIGKSTIVAIALLHYIIFNEHKTVGIASNLGSGSVEVLSRIKLAYQELPLWLQIPVNKWNEGGISLHNGCKILTSSTTKDSFRGKSIAWLYVDETAHIDDDKWVAFSTSVLPTVSSAKTSKITYTSTPNGFNHFYRIVQDAKNNISNFKYLEFKWDCVPGRDINWKLQTIANIDAPNKEEIFKQEYDCAFISGGSSFFSSKILNNIIVKEQINDNNELFKIYKQPQKNRIYVAGVDVSKGVGKHFSVMQILDITNIKKIEQVAIFRGNKVSPLNFSPIIVLISKLYNNCDVLIENNKDGGILEDLFYNYEFPNILSNEKHLGITTSTKTRPMMLDLLNSYLKYKKLIINDFTTLNELSTFIVKSNGRIEAENGRFDDTVLALAIALYCIKLNVYDLNDVNISEYKNEAIHTIIV